MFKRLLAGALLAITMACIHPNPPAPPAQRAIAVRTCVPGAVVRLGAPQIPDGVPNYNPLTADAQGNATFGPVTTDLPSGMIVEATAPGYPKYSFQVTAVPVNNHQFIIGPCVQVTDPNFQTQLALWQPTHVDPSGISLQKLAAIRGSMWTARYPMPWGPRPGQPSNILVTSSIHQLPTAEQPLAWKSYTDHGYTHGVIGPWQAGPMCGYHDMYPCETLTISQYLDVLQDHWDHGVAPVTFMKPDNWNCSEFTALLTNYNADPRAQKLIRIAVIGWEPDQNTSNAEYVCWARALAQTFPKALRIIHMTADFDAPGNNDDFTPGTPRYIGNAEAWNRVAPYLHGFGNQVGGYVFGSSPTPTPEFIQNFTNLYLGRGSLTDRFNNGYAGWPTHSAWPSGGLLVWAFEYAAYADFWKDWSESAAQDLGDVAIRSGSAGYLDGGRLTVPPAPR